MGTIGARLKSERLRLGLTQEEMAKAGGVARSAQANYEKGERSPDTQYLALAYEIGVDVAYVITGARATPAVDTLSSREAALINNFKKMADEDMCALERIAYSIQKP